MLAATELVDVATGAEEGLVERFGFFLSCKIIKSNKLKKKNLNCSVLIKKFSKLAHQYPWKLHLEMTQRQPAAFLLEAIEC